MFAPFNESPLRQNWSGIDRVSRSAATLTLTIALCLGCGIAQGATRKPARHAAPEGKTIEEAKTVQQPAPARRRLLYFYERFYPGAVRSFTTWW
jgi:hypothetical protein